MGDLIQPLKRKRKHESDIRRELLKKANAKARLISRISARIEKIRKRRDDLDTRSCIDRATTFLGLKLALLDMRENGWGGVVNAADRTDEHCDDCGDKSSQQELYACFQFQQAHGFCPSNCPSCFPANPPKSGSHEGYADATLANLFDVMVGTRLDWHEWGLDLSDPDAFAAAAKRLGYKVARPYPNEPWHFNFTENPRETLIRRGRV